MAKKFYEVQSHIVLTGHITESMVTVVGGHVWNRLTPDEQRLFADTMKEAASKATEAIEASERGFGRPVHEARQDRGRARSRGVPEGGDPAA